MPGPKAVIGDPTPEFLKPGNASVLDPPYIKALRRLISMAPMINPLNMIAHPEQQAIAAAMPAQLPMNAAAQAERAAAQGFTHDVYHSTKGNFSEFDPNRMDLGIHVTPDPATANRALGTNFVPIDEPIGNISQLRGQNVMPLKARMRKTLRLPDVSLWKNPSHWVTNLGDRGTVMAGKPRLKADLDTNDIEAAQTLLEAAWAHRGKPNVGYMTEPNGRQWGEDVRKILQNYGYDSIEYLNNIEGKGEPSYLLPYAQQVRSRFATFDPAKLRSKDLLAGGAGAAAALSAGRKKDSK